jgi:hypothetical protein
MLACRGISTIVRVIDDQVEASPKTAVMFRSIRVLSEI